MTYKAGRVRTKANAAGWAGSEDVNFVGSSTVTGRLGKWVRSGTYNEIHGDIVEYHDSTERSSIAARTHQP